MKRKKGSSLITVIIFMMFLMMVGATTITMVTMDYKFRLNESERIENLYGAESGLEIAYDILLKASDYAINEAIYVTNEQLKIDVEKPSTERGDLNELFKKTYLKVLFDKTYNHSLASQQTMTEGLATYLLKNLKYPIVNESSKLEFQSSGFNLSDKNMAINVELLDSNGNEINSFDQEREILYVEVTSSFETEEENRSNSKIERKVSRTFEFKVPNYTQELVDLYPVFNGKALAVDGNVSLTGTNLTKSKLDITGDVWVGGNICTNKNESCSDTISDVTYQKYSRGILLEEANLTIDDVLATKETLALRNEAVVHINGNMYGKNIYMGKKDVAATSTNSELKISGDSQQYDTVLVNDLAVNVSPSELVSPTNNLAVNVSPSKSVHSTIEIDKFYGVSDKNVSQTDIQLDKVEVLSQESSSIIVNAEGASVDIKHEALIAGLAFLDVIDGEKNKYQTGESVAVKPNYLAYSMIAKDLEDKLTFRYYDPLMLVEKIDTITLDDGTTINDKTGYFVQVNKNGLLSMSSGGVKLPSRLYTAGAIVNQDNKALGSQGLLENMSDIKQSKLNDYDKYVQQMGFDDENIKERTVSNQINWGAEGFDNVVTNTELGTIILNKNAKEISIIEENDEYFLQFDGQNRQEISNYIFLITKGDLNFEGNVDLIGNIMVGGDVDLDDSTNNGSIQYNESFMKDVLSKNKELFKDIFVDSGKVSTSVSSTESIDYNATTIIKKGRWQLVK